MTSNKQLMHTVSGTVNNIIFCSIVQSFEIITENLVTVGGFYGSFAFIEDKVEVQATYVSRLFNN